MTRKTNKNGTSWLRRRIALLAILPVALLQLTIAVHQFDHIDDYGADACDVCVQLDRLDTPVDPATDAAPLPLTESLITYAPSAHIASATFRNFDSRAPPRL